MAKPVYILNGPNLNLLGTREPDVYGHDSLSDIEKACVQKADDLGLTLVFRQSKHEGELIDWLREADQKAFAVLLNPAAYSHTSIAIHDAIKAISVPVIEIHLSNPASREPFRHLSYVSSVAKGVISGLGADGYVLGLQAISNLKMV